MIRVLVRVLVLALLEDFIAWMVFPLDEPQVVYVS